MGVLEVDGRRVAVSSLDKVLWPKAGFTKGQMLDYYARVAPSLLPHLRGRPITLRRFPEGVEAGSWYQNDCPAGGPSWVARHRVVWPSGRAWEFCRVDDLATLLWVANLGTVELHPFFALAERLEEPTGVVFDLDPGPPADLEDCRRVALHLRDLLAELGLDSVIKVSGGVGLHVVVPLNAPHTWEQTKAFARSLAASLVAERPDEVVDRQARSLRKGKVLVDWLQNDPTRSTVAPYSLRGYGWPTVSAPVSWDEVETGASLVFEPAAVLERVDRLGDLFRPALEREQRLPG